MTRSFVLMAALPPTQGHTDLIRFAKNLSGDALVVVDSLESLPGGVARRVFGAARNIEDGGSLTVVAATGMAWEPQRQASTRVSLDPPADDGTS